LLVDFGDLYEAEQFPECDAVIVSHCYDDQTEILTENGWKLFKNLEKNEKVATLSQDGYLEFQLPTEYIEQDYNGLMYVLKTKYLDLCVTPNHKLYVKMPEKNNGKRGKEGISSSFRLVEAREAFGRYKTFLKTAKWKGKELEEFILPRYFDSYHKKEYSEKRIPIVPFLRLLGWYIAEGCSTKWTVQITQYNERNRENIKQIIKACGFESKEYGSCITIHNVQLASYLNQFGSYAWEKRVPEFIKDLTPVLIKEFLDSLFSGDGWKHKNCRRLVTSSKKLIDDVQELLIRIGSSGNIAVIPEHSSFNGKYLTKTSYKITWMKKYIEVRDRHRTLGLAKGSVEEFQEYNGKIYCVNVPNHVILVRRNGKPVWCGNSHPDHLFGLEKIVTKVPVYLSELTLNSEYYDEDKYEHLDRKKYSIKRAFTIGDLKIKAVPILHSTKAPNVALFIEDSKGFKICYASDVVSIKKEYRDRYLKGTHIYIGDMSTHEKGGLVRKSKKEDIPIGHADIRTQLAWCRDAGVRVCIFTHLGTKPIKLGNRKLREYIKPLEQEYNVKIIVANDNDEFDVEDLITMSEREMLQLKPKDVEPITPKEFPKEPKAGLYLTEPHGELIWKGKKTLIVKHRKFEKYIDEPLYLISGDLCYGVIWLKEPKKITKEEFDKLRDQHMITEEEYEEWDWSEPLYAYEFMFKPFPAPKPVRIPKGIQTFVRAENIEFIKPNQMTNEELEKYHAFYHSCAELFSPCCEAHFIIANEMLDRGMIHLSRTVCDRVVYLIRESVEDYIKNIKNVDDRPLGDDWRIVLAWYSSLKEGKTLKRKDGTPITIDDTKKLGLAIVKEMIRRHGEYKKKGITKFTFNKPETYKKYARELFEWIVKQIGEDKIPWKEEQSLFSLPAGMTIDDIDPQFVITLTNEELISLWKMLVNIAEHSAQTPEEIPENIHNAGVFVGIEMYKRGLWEEYRGENILEQAVELEVMEYKTPKGTFQSKEIPEPEGDYIYLEDVVKALPVHITLSGEPYDMYLAGRVVNEGKIPKDHDIDIIIKGEPDPRIVKALKSISPKWLAKRIHPVFDKYGPLIGYSLNVYRKGFFKIPYTEMIRGFGPFRFEHLAKEVKIGKPIVGAKPKSGFEKYEFWDPKEMYKEWAKQYIDEGIFVQEKVDGRRMHLHVDKEKDFIKIFTEDRQRDRSKQFPNIVKEIMDKLNCKSCVLDGEMVAFEIPANVTVKSAKVKRNNYDLMEREDTAQITVGKVSPEFEDKIVYVFYDIMYLDGESIVDKPYSERFKLLQRVVPKNARYLDLVKTEFADNPREFLRAVEKMRRVNGSEGVVAKAASMTYPVKYKGENRTEKMCKLKNLKEIDVMVWDVVEKKRKETGEPLGNYMYVSVFLIPEDKVDDFPKNKVVEYKGKHYAIIGRSYATDVKCKRGDIITVMPIRIREYKTKDGKRFFTWMFPYFKEKRTDKKEPDTLTTVERIAKLGTRPAELSKEIVIDLELCPFSEDKSVCPLKMIFGKPRYDELTKLKIQYLRFPVACPIASVYRCVFLKSYYYGYKEFERRSFE